MTKKKRTNSLNWKSLCKLDEENASHKITFKRYHSLRNIKNILREPLLNIINWS